MKTYPWSALAISCLAILFCSTFVPLAHARSAQLIIHRAADFGDENFLRIWVDGKEAKAIAYGHDFTAPISPGQHTIAVLDGMNSGGFKATRATVNVQNGGTYTFTAFWRNGRVLIQKN